MLTNASACRTRMLSQITISFILSFFFSREHSHVLLFHNLSFRPFTTDENIGAEAESDDSIDSNLDVQMMEVKVGKPFPGTPLTPAGLQFVELFSCSFL